MDDLLTAHSIAHLLILGRDAGQPPETLQRCRQLLDHAEVISAKRYDHYLDIVRMLDQDPAGARLTHAYHHATAMVANGAKLDDLDELSEANVQILDEVHRQYGASKIIPSAPRAKLTQEGQEQEEYFRAIHKRMSSL